MLIERLGKIETTPVDKQQAWIGVNAKSPVTLATLLQRTWQLERAAGIVSSAAPEPLPIDARAATAIAPAPPEKQHGDSGEADAGAAAFAPIPTGATTLVVYRAPGDANADAVAAQIAFLAGVFERASFRVTAKGGDKAAKAIAVLARDKQGVAKERLATGSGEPQGTPASVEVLALP